MQNEIDRMIAGQFNAEDDLELNSELEALMGGAVPAAGEEEEERAAAATTTLPAVPSHEVHVLPEVPTGPVVTKEAEAKQQKEKSRQAVSA